MTRTPLSVLIFPVLLSLALPSASAIDLGGSTTSGGGDDPIQVEVVNEQAIPVFVSNPGIIQQITGSAQLEFEQEYKSPYFDVRDYRYIDFYVIPEKTLNDPHPEARYKLDAFFSIESSMTEYKKFGSRKEQTEGGGGFQEFGTYKIKNDETAKNIFTQTTTGPTASKILHTRVYGPFVRVVLKNLTEEGTQKYKVVAYLTR